MKSELLHGDTFVERRQQPRLPMKIFVKYQTLEKYDSERIKKSNSMNISATGLSLRSYQEMLTNETITLQIYIPREDKRQSMSMMVSCPEEDCRKVTILARVVWCRPGDNGHYIFGAEFLNVSLDDQEFMNQFLLDYRMPEPGALQR